MSWSKKPAELGRLPVVNFAAGGVATPADAALMMQLAWMACLSVGHLQERRPGQTRQSHCRGRDALQQPEILAEVSEDLGEAMVGINVTSIPAGQLIAGRGW